MQYTFTHILLVSFCLLSLTGISQTQPTSKKVVIEGVSVIDPRQKPTSFAPLLKNLEAPSPGVIL